MIVQPTSDQTDRDDALARIPRTSRAAIRRREDRNGSLHFPWQERTRRFAEIELLEAHFDGNFPARCGADELTVVWVFDMSLGDFAEKGIVVREIKQGMGIEEQFTPLPALHGQVVRPVFFTSATADLAP